MRAQKVTITRCPAMASRPVHSVPDFKSDFAIIDVKQGRGALAKLIRDGGKVLVRVDLLIDTVHSQDDGTSIEFGGEVKAIRQLPA